MVRLSFRALVSLAAIIILCSVLLVTVYGQETEVALLPGTEEIVTEIILDSPEDLREPLRQNSVVVVQPPVKDVAPVTPSDSSGLKAILLQLFGNYDPVVIEYAYTNTNGYVSYIREIEPDYAWMISAAIFAIVLYCFFRLLGGLLKK